MKFVCGNFTANASDNFRHKGGSYAIRRSGDGSVESIVKVLEFEFLICLNGEQALNNRFQQIRSALSGDGLDVGFMLDNSTPSEIFIKSSETIGGTLCGEIPLPQPTAEGGDYETGLLGTCTFVGQYTAAQAGFEVPGQPNPLINFSEDTEIRGNGKARTFIEEYDRGLPVKYTLADRTKVTGSQSGVAVYLTKQAGQFPNPNPPLYPEYLINETESVRKSLVQAGKQWQNRIAWNYLYEHIDVFDLKPTPR